MMKTINQFNFLGIRVIMRVDFNVPLNEQNQVTDETRIAATIPSIKKILNDGGSVVLMSHLGRPKSGPEEKSSLKHLLPLLHQKLGCPLHFVADCIGSEALKASENLKKGEVLLLENLRFHAEEEKGDAAFAKELSKHAQFYVNDAFGTAHRQHASTAVIADYFDSNHKCFGYVMANEIASIDMVLNNAKKPFTAIIGGAKVSDKILIIEQLMDKADTIVIGGGMAFTFIKAMGGKIGNSLCEEDRLGTAKGIIEMAKQKGVKLLLPEDAIVADQFSNEAKFHESPIDAIEDGWMGLDIGKKSQSAIDEEISVSKTILWNGPMGVFELPNFEKGTMEVALSITRATKNGAYSLIGGGDSVAAINKYKLADQVSYLSTGGGALLEYIEQGSLPGVNAINK